MMIKFVERFKHTALHRAARNCQILSPELTTGQVGADTCSGRSWLGLRSELTQSGLGETAYCSQRDGISLAEKRHISLSGTWRRSLRYAIVMTMMIIGGGLVNNAWAQEDLTGVYYIANNNTNAFNASDATNNWYLVPASNVDKPDITITAWTWNNDPSTPLVTTYQTKKDINSVWVVKKSGNYYQLIHVLTNKYMTLNAGVGTNSNRRAVHMETPSPLGDNHLFTFTSHSGTPTFYSINPKTKISGHKYLNPSNGNKATYYASSTKDGGYDVGGTIGLYEKDANGDAGSKWFLESTGALLPAPTIAYDAATDEYTISYDRIPEGFDILYTTNDSEPTMDGITTTTVSAPAGRSTTVSASGGFFTVKAVIARYGVVLTRVASQPVGHPDSPTITLPTDCSNLVEMSAGGASVYYTLDGSTPDNSSTLYTGPFVLNEDATVKAIAYVGSLSSNVTTANYTALYSAQPTISRSGATVTISGTGNIYYTTDDSDPDTGSTPYTGPITLSDGTGDMTIKAVAKNGSRNLSCVAEMTITLGYFISDIAQLNAIASHLDARCIVTQDINASGLTASIGDSSTPFTGIFDGDGHTISGLTKPLFGYTNNAKIYNVMLDEVSISSGADHTGALVGTAKGDTRIYNVGVLGGSLSAANNKHCGGIVGQLENDSRVINCFSYANIEGGNKVGGIVGNNQVASGKNTKRDAAHAMVMNCMFYGDITGGISVAPIFNGTNIDNRSNNKGVNTFNYFLSTAAYVQDNTITKVYNSATAAEPRFLQRFEFFRYTLNSNRALAAWWATGSTANADQMYKWVMEPENIHGTHPYPVLKPQGFYHSIVNYDPAQTYDPDNGTMISRASVDATKRNRGRQIGTISINGTSYPVLDKDDAMWNYTYGCVQLPYYTGGDNYQNGRVVTGWKISVTGTNKFELGTDIGSNGKLPYNFADRSCTGKDNYSTSSRVYAQGAYWPVPEGVSAITIEPYWAKAVYLSDPYYDETYNSDLKNQQDVTLMGQRYVNGESYTINGSSQAVYTSMDIAVGALFGGEDVTGKTPYDYAVVLVGNYHLAKLTANITFQSGSNPFTLMSADLDKDNEPDNTFFYQHSSRKPVAPIRFDFINIPGMGMVQKGTDATNNPNVGIFQPNGWFEITNTVNIRLGQFEYDKQGKTAAPLILLGGVIDQIVSCNTTGMGQNTVYIHLGGNVWMNEFQIGTHQDKTYTTRHVPVSVTGGEYGEFHLTGTYRPDATIYDDDAECYINGGKFGIVSGAGNEGLGTSNNKGNVTWQIDHADMDEFYGGGLNFAKPIKGNINTTISNSRVEMFCGGPKFGDMQPGKTVTTTATNCIFGKFFGAGYGGNSYNRFAPKNLVASVNYDWNTWLTTGVNPEDNKENFSGYKNEYNSTYQGVATNFTYEFIPLSGGMGNNVARLMINHVGFSLATTNDVTSTLTGCTINGNFYGGGSLGKVNGDATSTLTDCTVKGSVFGAGYSASLPSVMVMNTTGFKVEPEYLPGAGVYKEGVEFPDEEEYHWEHAETVNSTATAINKDTKTLYTTEDLTTLGTVSGNVTLNLTGSTVVEGKIINTNPTTGKIIYDASGEPTYTGQTNGVFGGGDESAVIGADKLVTVNINTTSDNHNTKYIQNVYGGGNNGDVASEVQVNVIGSSYVKNDVYGGGKGKKTIVEGDVTVNIGTKSEDVPPVYSGNAEIGHNVYGGSAFGNTNAEKDNDYHPESNPTAISYVTDKTTHVNFYGGAITGSVYGGGLGQKASGEPGDPGYTPAIASNVYGPVTVTVEGGTAGNVFGCNDQNGAPQSTVIVNVEGTAAGTNERPYAIGNVYGGGNLADYAGTPDVDISGNSYVDHVFGGGNQATVNATDVAIRTTNTDGSTVMSKINKVYGGGNQAGTTGNATVLMTSGNVIGTVYGGCNINGSIGGNTEVTVTGGSIGTSSTGNAIFGGGYGAATSVAGDVTVNVGAMSLSTGESPTATFTGDATILGSVYGGGEQGSVNTEDGTNTTTVNLFKGTINGKAYGGGLGDLSTLGEGHADVPAYVYGDVYVNLNGTTVNSTPYLVPDASKGCVVNQVFGCNNINGTPKKNVTVHVYGTQNANLATIQDKVERELEATGATAKEQLAYWITEATNAGVSSDLITAAQTVLDDGSATETQYLSQITILEEAISGNRYDVRAVYGGGNEAAYDPTTPYHPESAATGAKTRVIIEGCDRTNIENVYGGGNAASVPETNVEIMSAHEILTVFGGGNGKDAKESNGSENLGADVGRKDYDNSKTYGTGIASVSLQGGYIHEAYGGSNEKGEIVGGANLETSASGECTLKVERIYGGGKNASMSGDINITMGCQENTWTPEVYAGAKAADVNGNATLTITSGKFDRVFGGNMTSGLLKGAITVNIEETGTCAVPIVIGELYAGGYEADYSVYGYKNTGTVETPVWVVKKQEDYDALSDAEKLLPENEPYNDPQLNIRSFTSIGAIYGGGYKALLVGNSNINIDVVKGSHADDVTIHDGVGDIFPAGTTGNYSLPYPAHKKGEIGVIGDIYGGGYQADLFGNTAIHLGTKNSVDFITEPTHLGERGVAYVYNSTTKISTVAAAGVNVTGNVYGGGNAADIIGNTNITIGTVDLTGEGKFGTKIGGDVYGGGFGPTTTVTGNVEVNIGGDLGTAPAHNYVGFAAITGNVYGGSAKGKVNATNSGTKESPVFAASSGKTDVNFYGGTITGNLYGGGYGLDDAAADVYGPITVNVYKGGSTTTSVANVFGGNNVNGVTRNTIDVNIAGGTVSQNVYGGGNNADALGDVTVDFTGGSAVDVYGGGKGQATTVSANVTVNIGKKTVSEGTPSYSGTGAISGNVYGGSALGAVNATKDGGGDLSATADKETAVNIYAGTVSGSVFGGGLGETSPSAIVAQNFGNTSVTMEGGTVTTAVYGGANANGVLKGNSTVTITGGTVNAAPGEGDPILNVVFGGGYGAPTIVDGDVQVNIGQLVEATPTGNATIYGNVYGGSAMGKVNGTTATSNTHTTQVNLNKGTVNGAVYGGGLGDADHEANVYGLVTVTTKGGTATDVFGCNNIKGAPQQTVAVNIDGGTFSGNVYGGGNQAAYTGGPAVTMSNGTATNVFGGGLGSTATVTGNPSVTISGGTVSNDVYGGGSLAKVAGSTSVTVSSNGKVNNDVFGGGKEADVTQNVTVTISGGTVTNDVYGGGALANTNTDNWNFASDLYVDVTDKLTNGKSLVTGLYTESGGDYTEITTPDTRAADATTYYQKGNWNEGHNDYNSTTKKYETTYKTTVNLTGGIVGNAYGGGLGRQSVAAVAYEAATTYTAETAAAYNAALAGAIGAGAVLTGDKLAAVNGLTGVSKTYTVGETILEVDANLYNSALKGAVKAGDTKPAVEAVAYAPGVEANVYGDVTVTVNGTAFTHSFVTPTDVAGTAIPDALDVPLTGRVFGCNNLYGTPKGHVLVEVDRTLRITDAGDVVDDHQENIFEIHSVYGGGNLSTYQPSLSTAKATKVIIRGCEDTSIEKVFGGGNSASVPSTDVLILGTFYVGYAFSGGNGADMYLKDGKWLVNNGAPVYGDASIYAIGGKIGQVFGGSDTKGEVYGTATTKLKGKDGYAGEEGEGYTGGCDYLKITNAYGAGRGAGTDGDVNFIVNGCSGSDDIERVFGGSYDADIRGSITLTITSGIFSQVIGGNDHGGNIGGEINVNIEETEGCNPIVIQYLYGGGREADYPGDKARYITNAKDANGDYIGDLVYHSFPDAANGKNAKITVNVKSATRIDHVYGGSYRAKVNGDTEVNINMIKGSYINRSFTLPDGYRGDKIPNSNMDVTYDEVTEGITVDVTPVDGWYTRDGDVYTKINDQTATAEEGVTYYQQRVLGSITIDNAIGTIGNVFGGCFEGEVNGNTSVNIGTESTVQVLKRNGSGKIVDALNNEIYDENGKLIKGKEIAWADPQTSLGAHITGNVYGGGHEALVTGNVALNIGAKDSGSGFAAVAQGKDVLIEGNVFGGGKGALGSFTCAKGMVGIDGENNGTEDQDKGTKVRIGNGTVNGTVYGGGEVGRVEWNTEVTLGYGDGVASGTATSEPVVVGNVFGAGKGDKSYGYSALTRGKSTVTVQGNAKVRGSVYGGGEMASVGKYRVVDGLPENLFAPASTVSGYCYVNIRGYAEIGPDNMEMPAFSGNVFGAGQGILPYVGYEDNVQPFHMNGIKDGNNWIDDPTYYKAYSTSKTEDEEEHYFKFIQTLALATQGNVTIGGHAFIKGSVYGGSENGYVQHNTNVIIAGDCQIGNGKGVNRRYTDTEWSQRKLLEGSSEMLTTYAASLPECASWTYGQNHYAPYDPFAQANGKYEDGTDAQGGYPTADDGHTYYGNVFGGGSGRSPYRPGKWFYQAGLVKGNTNVTITGGHILTNIYGGNELTDVDGMTTVKFGGNATLGVPRTLDQILAHPVTCYLFGAGKGKAITRFKDWTNVAHAIVKVTGGTIFGSVFGGAEDGHVKGHVKLDISNNTSEDNHVNLQIGTWGSSYVDGNVFGGGRGYGGDSYTGGNVGGSIDIDITGGTMLGSIYGGGRLGSVGYSLIDNQMKDDDKDDDGNTTDFFTKDYTDAEDNPIAFKKGRGHVDLEIDGSSNTIVIGNNYEFQYIPGSSDTPEALATARATYHVPVSDISYDASKGRYTLNHAVGGSVHGGGMGRRELLGQTSANDKLDWWKLGNVKSTKVYIHGSNVWVRGTVYGGGELGAVRGSHTTKDRNNNDINVGTEVIIDGATVGSVIGDNINAAEATKTTVGSGDNRYTFGGVYGGSYGTDIDATLGTLISELDIFGGLVESNTSVKIQGTTAVRSSVYGGGKVACVGGDTYVDISGGTVGLNEVRSVAHPTFGKYYVLFGGMKMGNVYGGGRGSEKSIVGGVIKGNTHVNISQADPLKPTGIYHNVYGGGALGSVGTFDLSTAADVESGVAKFANVPVNWTSGGTATVTITGGTIGINGHDNGMVNGSSRGDISTSKPALGNSDLYDHLAWVKDAVVTIGEATSGLLGGGAGTNVSSPDIKGSVYGGGENGHNYGNATVNIHSGTIGVVDNTIEADDTWSNRGSIYGAGCGTDTYSGSTDDLKLYNPMGGRVQGNTTINIDGGHIIRNVYGGGSMGSVDGHSAVNIYGGRIGTDGLLNAEEASNGDVFGGPKGSLKIDPNDSHAEAHVENTTVNINYATTPTSDDGSTTQLIVGSVYGGGEAGLARGTVAVNMLGGLVMNNVYGGGALANTNTNVGQGTGATDYETVVNLLGGIIKHEAYGGALGQNARAGIGSKGDSGYRPAHALIEPKVYGDILVKLNDNNNGGTVDGSKKGCIVDKIFGCNDLQGTPNAHVTVHVFGTQSSNASNNQINLKFAKRPVQGETGYENETSKQYLQRLIQAAYSEEELIDAKITASVMTSAKATYDNASATDAEVSEAIANVKGELCKLYDVQAVYGGGDLAAYQPADNNLSTIVIIDGCDYSSIYQVYGGGNAAPVPATSLRVNGSYEIEESFGGGNGKDNFSLSEVVKDGSDNDVIADVWYENPGANVGYRNYTHYVKKGETGYNAETHGAGTQANPYKAIDYTDAATKEARQENYGYGSGQASSEIGGGRIHYAYGGSNRKGNIRTTAMSLYEGMDDTCPVEVDETYGAGKDAPQDGNIDLKMDCVREMQEIFGGAKNADVHADVMLNITNGSHFKRVFGGNNTSGAITGSITVNIEEKGCEPIKIEELYLGGYLAPYSIYGYEDDGMGGFATEEKTYDEVGTIDQRIPVSDWATYKATLQSYLDIATTWLNNHTDSDPNYTRYQLEKASITERINSYPKKDPRINIISATRIDNVFGGGYKALVVGNPRVNVNMTTGKMEILQKNTGTEDAPVYVYQDVNNEVYNLATLSPETVDGKTKYWYPLPLGTIGNIYGGGNLADINGDTYVEIGTGQWVNDDEKVEREDTSGKKYTFENRSAANEEDWKTKWSEYAEADKADWKWYMEGEDTPEATTPDSKRNQATITENVFGGGKGVADHFACDKAMVGIDGEGLTNPQGGTSVVIGNGTVQGNVYGGGLLGRVEKNTMVTIGLESGNGEPIINGDVFGAGKGVNTHGYSALVRGSSTVTVQGDAKVRGSVYGGGEIASVGRYSVVNGLPQALYNDESPTSGYCYVTVKGNAEIGPDDMQMFHDGVAAADDLPDDKGHVFGAGKGVLPYEGYADNEEPYQINGIKDGNNWTDDPTNYKAYNDDSKTTEEENQYFKFIRSLALATETSVTITDNAFVKGSVYGGAENGYVQHNTHVLIDGDCQIGNGFVQMDDDGNYLDSKKSVNRRYTAAEWAAGKLIDPLSDGTSATSYSSSLPECASWKYGVMENTKLIHAPHDIYASTDEGFNDKYDDHTTSTEGGRRIASDGHTFYGNVFGGGSGYYPYRPGKWFKSAGAVHRNTYLTIKGGHILTNAYGGNEMTDVGNYDTEHDDIVYIPAPEGHDYGTCYITMIGGTLGVPRTFGQIAAHPVTCYLFGAGKGDQRIFFNKSTNVGNTRVYVADDARIYGSVFGGGEDGHVMEKAKLYIGTTELPAVYNTDPILETLNLEPEGTKEKNGILYPYIGTCGTSYVDGNIFGGGRGFSGDAYTAGNVGGSVDLNIKGGTMLGSIYGGGRLGSVGYDLLPPNDANYGKMSTDADRGHVTINISGGTIGNDAEFAYAPSDETIGSTGNLRFTVFEDYSNSIKAAYNDSKDIMTMEYEEDGKTIKKETIHKVKHTKGGNVFAGGMGRRMELDNTTPMADAWWPKLGNVKSTKLTITGGTIKGNVYGGGEMGAVTGHHTTDGKQYGAEVIITGGTIGTEVKKSGVTQYTFGSVYGGGMGLVYNNSGWKLNGGNVADSTRVSISGADTKVLASVFGGGEFGIVGKNSNVTITGGEIGKSTVRDDGYVLFGGATMGNVYGAGEGSINEVHAGQVKGNTNVLIREAIATEEDVTAYAEAHPGAAPEDLLKVGDVISSPKIYHMVYGGGALASVGTFDVSDGKGHPPYMPIAGIPYRWYYDDGETIIDPASPAIDKTPTGTATVTIKGGTIGVSGRDNGLVFGGSRGDISNPLVYFETKDEADEYNTEHDLHSGDEGFKTKDDIKVYGFDEHLKMAYVNRSEVNIGTVGTGRTSPLIKGSVYGGGENGHNIQNATVNINSGTIGIVEKIPGTETSDPWWDFGSAELNEKYYADRGNVYGAGSGADTYKDRKGYEHYNPKAGMVGGSSVVNIKGGHVVHNVYGAGSMASVGNITNANDTTSTAKHTDEATSFALSWPYKIDFATNTGKATVNVTGGHIGIGGNRQVGKDNGNIYGGPRGVAGDRYAMAHLANVKETQVNINFTPASNDTTLMLGSANYDKACIEGSVFGGGENGHVMGDTYVTLTNGFVSHSVFGGGRGEGKYKGKLKKVVTSAPTEGEMDIFDWTAGKVYGNTHLTIVNGRVLNNVIGGGYMASVGVGNYSGGTDDFYPAGYGETIDEALWEHSEDFNPNAPIVLPPAPGVPGTYNIPVTNADYFLSSGKTYVNIYGGEIGSKSLWDGLPAGNIFGGCRGMAAPSLRESPRYKYNPEWLNGYTNETHVTIGEGKYRCKTAYTDGSSNEHAAGELITGDAFKALSDEDAANWESYGPKIYGSVYGGAQDGRVRRDAHVVVNSGEIGLPFTEDNRSDLVHDPANITEELDNPQWLHRGNVYGAGSGIGKYKFDFDYNGTTSTDTNGNGIIEDNEVETSSYYGIPTKEEDYCPFAGSVIRYTTVDILGGTIHRNVYGGGSLGSVGPPAVPPTRTEVAYKIGDTTRDAAYSSAPNDPANGLTTIGQGWWSQNIVNIGGAGVVTIGTPDDFVEGFKFNKVYGGEVYGASRGIEELKDKSDFSYSIWTQVNILKGARILGNVFGGGDTGAVKKDSEVNVGVVTP